VGLITFAKRPSSTGRLSGASFSFPSLFYVWVRFPLRALMKPPSLRLRISSVPSLRQCFYSPACLHCSRNGSPLLLPAFMLRRLRAQPPLPFFRPTSARLVRRGSRQCAHRAGRITTMIVPSVMPKFLIPQAVRTNGLLSAGPACSACRSARAQPSPDASSVAGTRPRAVFFLPLGVLCVYWPFPRRS